MKILVGRALRARQFDPGFLSRDLPSKNFIRERSRRARSARLTQLSLR